MRDYQRIRQAVIPSREIVVLAGDAEGRAGHGAAESHASLAGKDAAGAVKVPDVVAGQQPPVKAAGRVQEHRRVVGEQSALLAPQSFF